MSKRKLKCPKCDRRFSMPAHLARHVNAAHGSKTKKPAATPRRRTGSDRSASTMGAADVLSSLRAYHSELAARSTAVDLQCSAVDAAINALGATPARLSSRPATRRTRGTGGERAGSLKSYILKVLRPLSIPQGPAEIARRVVKAGYRSQAIDLAKAVNNALATMNGVKKVGFGRYRV